MQGLNVCSTKRRQSKPAEGQPWVTKLESYYGLQSPDHRLNPLEKQTGQFVEQYASETKESGGYVRATNRRFAQRTLHRLRSFVQQAMQTDASLRPKGERDGGITERRDLLLVGDTYFISATTRR
ncbi:hypothetical protein HPB48_005851 [Haemaphysalis longicornis]|uniref:Uncharacterized protein n=1 Tax=Haemaphysalis longicornis TaxID=44386 RepID=A0A9J6GPR7_HAELO|nr:hypothetical protein HPB48_005851 [Haemaphysalis longicornis]